MIATNKVENTGWVFKIQEAGAASPFTAAFKDSIL